MCFVPFLVLLMLSLLQTLLIPVKGLKRPQGSVFPCASLQPIALSPRSWWSPTRTQTPTRVPLHHHPPPPPLPILTTPGELKYASENPCSIIEGCVKRIAGVSGIAVRGSVGSGKSTIMSSTLLKATARTPTPVPLPPLPLLLIPATPGEFVAYVRIPYSTLRRSVRKQIGIVSGIGGRIGAKSMMISLVSKLSLLSPKSNTALVCLGFITVKSPRLAPRLGKQLFYCLV